MWRENLKDRKPKSELDVSDLSLPPLRRRKQSTTSNQRTDTLNLVCNVPGISWDPWDLFIMPQ